MSEEAVERKARREMVRSRCLMFRSCYTDFGRLFLYEGKYSLERMKAWLLGEGFGWRALENVFISKGVLIWA